MGHINNSPLSFVPQWFKVVKSYTDFQTAGLTNAITVYSLPAKGIVHQSHVNITTPFAGTTTCTLSVGKAGSLLKYVLASDAKTAALSGGVDLVSPIPESLSAATNLQANAIATIDNLSSLSAGVVEFHLLVSVLP